MVASSSNHSPTPEWNNYSETNTSAQEQEILPGHSIADLDNQRRQQELIENESQLVGWKENRARHKRLQHWVTNYNHFEQEYPISAILAYAEKRELDG